MGESARFAGLTGGENRTEKGLDQRREVSRDPWVHRSQGMRCATCIYYVEKETEDGRGAELGRCRRHAPTMNGYPVVFPSDWCGDHKLAEGRL